MSNLKLELGGKSTRQISWGARTEEHDHEAETDHAGEEAAGGGGIAESREVGELAEAVGTPEPAARGRRQRASAKQSRYEGIF